MTRASLGHSGHALAASALTRALYLAVIIAAFACAFLGFAVGYEPTLCRARQ